MIYNFIEISKIKKILKAPLEIVLNLTNKCNLNCLYCSNDANKNSDFDLTDDQILSIIYDIIEYKPFNVCFTGGEPLLRQNVLKKSINLLNKNNIRTVLLTNGTLLTKKIIDDLLNSGLNEIEISLDSLSETINNAIGRSHNYFTQIVDSIKYLKNLKFENFEISITLTSINIKNIISLLEFLINIGVKKFIIRPIIPVGRASYLKIILSISPLKYLQIKYNIYSYMKENVLFNKILVYYTDPLNHIYYFSNGFPFTGMEIKHNGSLIASPYIQLYLGNVLKHKIIEYWNAGWENIWQTKLFRDIYELYKQCNDIDKINKILSNIKNIDLIESPSRLYNGLYENSI